MFHQIKNSKIHHFSGIIYEHQSWDCHFHNSFELIYVISGELTATVNNINISVNTDDFLLISPCMAHSLESSAGTKFFIAIFTPDFVSEFNNTGSFYKFSVKGTTLEYLKENLIFSLKPSRLTLRSLLYAICSEAETAGADDTPSNRSSFVIAVNAYISENFSHDFRRKDISEALGYEEHYFSDLFHKSFGIGLKKYLNIYRFSKARKLLETTDQSITSVAFAQKVKNLPAVWEIQVQSLGREDPLEKEMATHSSILAWRILSRMWNGSKMRYPSSFPLRKNWESQSALKISGRPSPHRKF